MHKVVNGEKINEMSSLPENRAIDGFGGYQHYQSTKKAMEHNVATGFFEIIEQNQYERIYQCKECHTKWVLAEPDFPITGYLKQV